ncbi:VanZ family protein [Paenibacillus ehimensis]|uniref:VanZ family protein n=1 Tax=Paenibacillus ehimensis TaxID=79264 RepID=UPI003D282C28
MNPIRSIIKLLSLVPVLLWTLLIFHFSSQSYHEQSIQPILHKWFTKEGMLSVVPEMTIHYHHSTIEARKQPFEFVEFLFRKGSHLFMYAMLAVCAFFALVQTRWKLGFKILLAIVYVIGIASADEWNQAGSVERTSAMQDIVLDSIGGFLGLVVLILGMAVFCKIRRNSTLRRGEVP